MIGDKGLGCDCKVLILYRYGADPWPKIPLLSTVDVYVPTFPSIFHTVIDKNSEAWKGWYEVTTELHVLKRYLPFGSLFLGRSRLLFCLLLDLIKRCSHTTTDSNHRALPHHRDVNERDNCDT